MDTWVCVDTGVITQLGKLEVASHDLRLRVWILLFQPESQDQEHRRCQSQRLSEQESDGVSSTLSSGRPMSLLRQ